MSAARSGRAGAPHPPVDPALGPPPRLRRVQGKPHPGAARHRTMMGPAKAVADFIAFGETALPIEAYDPGRFAA